MIAALTLGDESGLSDADWEIFRLTGTTQILAISGFNIAIVAGEAFSYAAGSGLCGWHHQFHHPHPSVVRRYFDAGARGWSTAASGTLSLRVTADEGMGEMHEYHRESAKFWNAPAETLPEPGKQLDRPLPNAVTK